MKHETNSMPLVMEAPGLQWRVVKGLEGMASAYAQLPAGTDFTPALKGLVDDLCQCPHWGYVIEGKLNVKYQDDSVEVITGGSVFYLPPGHTVWAGKVAAPRRFKVAQEELVGHATSVSPLRSARV